MYFRLILRIPRTSSAFPLSITAHFTEWRTQALACLASTLGEGHVYVENFKEQVTRGFQGTVRAGLGILKATKEDIAAGDLARPPDQSPLLLLEQICSRFHLVARQLRSRLAAGRRSMFKTSTTFKICFTRCFVDVRPEEYTPSYAGKASRIDVLLKQEAIVVELKMTRTGLGPKELATQFIEDIERYKVHPDSEALLCFV